MNPEIDSEVPLREARVAVVGVGGLGCPAAAGLAAAGVGRLTLIDPDRVERSNLPRQLLHTDADVGRWKVDSAAQSLLRRHPQLRIERVRDAVSPADAQRYLRAADFVVDATDGGATKLLINDVALDSGVPYCHAGVIGFRGQVMVVIPGRGPCLRCVFPDLPEEEDDATCRQAGILGPVAGFIGALQASLAAAVLQGKIRRGGRLITYDGLADRWLEVDTRGAAACPPCRAAATGHPEGGRASWAT